MLPNYDDRLEPPDDECKCWCHDKCNCECSECCEELDGPDEDLVRDR